MNRAETDTPDTTYYAIFSDFTFQEIAGLISPKTLNPEPKFFIEKRYLTKTKSFFNSDCFLHFGYRLLKENFEHYQFTQNGWSIISIDEPINDRNSTVFYKISSPNGTIRNISNIMINESMKYKYFRIQGICNTLIYFQEFFKYPDWEYYDLKMEFLKLKQENEKINRKIYLQNKMLIANKLEPIKI